MLAVHSDAPFTADAVALACGVPRVELLAETDSTQDVAHQLAERGAPSGTLVVADAQRAGRGRHGRTWASHPGMGIWCTLIERDLQPAAIDVLSLRVGLYCAEALDVFAGHRVGVKWPNDLVILSEAKDLHPSVILSEAKDLLFRKLGGILVEARWSGSTLGWVAIGIGINVVAPPDVPHAAGLYAGTSRRSVLPAVVRAAHAAATASGSLSDDELRRFHGRDVLAGRRIVSPAAGLVRGINAAGSLVVQTSRGVQEVRSGTIELAEEQGREERA